MSKQTIKDYQLLDHGIEHGLGLHLLKCPSGVYQWVGSVPMCLMQINKATRADIMAGRTYTARDGQEMAYRPQWYRSVDEALEDARNNGEKVCELEGCACRSLFEN